MATLRHTRHHPAAAASPPVAPLDLTPRVDRDSDGELAALRRLICSEVYGKLAAGRVSVAQPIDINFCYIRQFANLVQGKADQVVSTGTMAELKVRSSFPFCLDAFRNDVCAAPRFARPASSFTWSFPSPPRWPRPTRSFSPCSRRGRRREWALFPSSLRCGPRWRRPTPSSTTTAPPSRTVG